MYSLPTEKKKDRETSSAYTILLAHEQILYVGFNFAAKVITAVFANNHQHADT